MSDGGGTPFGATLALAGVFALAYLLLSLFLFTLQALGPVSAYRLQERESRLRRVFGQHFYDTPSLLRVSLQLAHRLCCAAALLLLVVSLWSRGLAPGHVFGLGIAAFTMLVVLEQVLMKPLAIIAPERLFPAVVPALIGVHYLLLPLSLPAYWLLRASNRRLRRIRAQDGRRRAALEEEIEAFIEVGERQGIVHEEGPALLRGVLEFGNILVREVMTPRVEMVAIERSASFSALSELVARKKHSRIPVYRENLDRIEGLLHIRDLIPFMGQPQRWKGMGSILQPAHFVPETKNILELLREMQKSRQQLAIVVDEYGTTAGLVTIEDLLEEIVGEIADEHERQDDIIREADGTYLVSGLADLDRVEELFGTHLTNGEYDTVGGLIFSTLGRIPTPGEMLEVKGIRIEVLDADRQRVYRARLSPVGAAPPHPRSG
ncbi:MAG: hemolysin family protein [Acidobacteriota bacterium]